MHEYRVSVEAERIKFGKSLILPLSLTHFTLPGSTWAKWLIKEDLCFAAAAAKEEEEVGEVLSLPSCIHRLILIFKRRMEGSRWKETFSPSNHSSRIIKTLSRWNEERKASEKRERKLISRREGLYGSISQRKRWVRWKFSLSPSFIHSLSFHFYSTHRHFL